MKELRERMLGQLRAEGDPRALGNGAIFESYRYTGARDHSFDTWLKRQAKAPATVPPVP